MGLKSLLRKRSNNDPASVSKASGRTSASSNSNSYQPESVLHFISDPGDDISSIQVDGSVMTRRRARSELDHALSDEESRRSRCDSSMLTTDSLKALQVKAPETSSLSPSAQTRVSGIEVYYSRGDMSTMASDVCLYSLSLLKHSSQRDQSNPSEQILVDGLKRHIQLITKASAEDDASRLSAPRHSYGVGKEEQNLLEDTINSLIKEADYGQAIELYTGLLKVTGGLSQIKRADTLAKISILSLLQGDTKSSLDYGKQALKANRGLSRQGEVVVNLIVIGLLYFGMKQFEKALQHWREALQLICLVYGYDHPYSATILNNLGCLHYYEGDLGISLNTFTESHELNRGFLVSSVSNTNSILLNISITKSNIAMIAARSGEFDWAVGVLEEVLSIQSSVLTDKKNFVVETTSYAIVRLAEQRESPHSNASSKLRLPSLAAPSVASRTHGASDAAAVLSVSTLQPVQFEEAPVSIFGDRDGIPMRRLGTKTAVIAIDNSDILDFLMFGPLLHERTPTQRVRATILNWFGKTLEDDQNGKLRCVPFNGTPRKRIRIPVDVDEDAVIDAEFYLEAINEQATDHLEHDETDEARELFQGVLSSHIEKYGDIHHLVGTALHNIGLVHLYAKEYPQASIRFEKAAAVRGASLGPEHPAVAASLMKLGMISLLQKEPQRALDSFTRVLKLIRKSFGREHIQVARVLNNKAMAHYDLGAYNDACESLEEAIDILRKLLHTSNLRGDTPFNHTKVIELCLSYTLCNLAFILCRRRKCKQSYELYQEADLLQRKNAGYRCYDMECLEKNMRYVRVIMKDTERKERLEEAANIKYANNCLLDATIEEFRNFLQC